MVKVSIIMPVYNSKKFLEKAICSVLNQSLKEIELILVDDGSSDGSSEICDKFAQKDNRVIVIHQKNKGICGARNVGLKNAQGDYIMFIDNDDEIKYNTCEDNYNLALKYDADVVKFGREIVYINDSVVTKNKFIKYESKLLKQGKLKEEIIKLFYNQVFMCIWDGIYKKSLMIDFCENFKMGGEDIYFCLEILPQIKVLLLNEKIYYKHYIRNNYSTSTKYNANVVNDVELIYDKYKILEDNNHIEIYNLSLIKNLYNAIFNNFSNDKCSLSYKEKKDKLKKVNLKFMKKSNPYKMIKISKKLFVEYIFIKLNLWDLILKSFNIKNKQKEKI